MITNTDLPCDRPRRILLIENSEFDRRWLRARLASDSVHVLDVEDGAKGLMICHDEPPDLILLNLGPPLCEGFDTLRALKEQPHTRHVPVIVVSASAGTADIVQGLDAGAVDYVTKPYDLVELQARIRVALRTKRFQELLERRAHLDGLTGLANRMAMEERLATEWGLFQRHGGSLALWVADLDDFKRINDRYGHSTGDQVLRHTAAILRSSVRSTDMAARYGGEEFVVIAPHCPILGAFRTAERFRQRLASSPIVLDRVSITATISIGVSAVPEGAVDSPAKLLSLADRALYLAKAQGRNKVLFAGLVKPHDEPALDGWILTQTRA